MDEEGPGWRAGKGPQMAQDLSRSCGMTQVMPGLAGSLDHPQMARDLSRPSGMTQMNAGLAGSLGLTTDGR